MTQQERTCTCRHVHERYRNSGYSNAPEWRVRLICTRCPCVQFARAA